jgi:ribose transport system substrate-binding protein
MKRIWIAFIVILCGLTERSPAGVTASAIHTRPYHIAIIIKATDSAFWLYAIVGAVNYSLDNPDKAKVSWYGPKSETDIDRQVALLEDIVSKKPDAIVIASTSSDATVPALEKAIDQGITVVTIDNKVHSDKIPAFLATNNRVGGALCADQMIASLKTKGIPLRGTVGLASAMAGIEVFTDRDQGFRDRMNEIAPDVNVLETPFTDNDIAKSLAASGDIGWIPGSSPSPGPTWRTRISWISWTRLMKR